MLFAALVLAGCDPFDDGERRSDLDERLEQQLLAVADGQGLGFFLLPESDDLQAIPQDPRNPLTPAKVRLGRLLFHDAGLLTNPERPEGRFASSCASCHHAAAGFQAGRVQGIGEGGAGFGQRGEGRTRDARYSLAELDVQPIRSPAALNGAYQRVMLWNGQFGAVGPNRGTEAQWTPGTPKETNALGYEGLETQAIAGLKVHRMGDVGASVAASDLIYQRLFAEAFPDQPIDRERAGLAIAAYERTLLAHEAPFQQWLRGRRGAMSAQEKEGALLFFGKAECSACHTGPALNSMSFHALGMADLGGPGVFLDGDNDLARPEDLGRGGFTGAPADMYAFKTPQLYNLTDSPFLGHGAALRSVREVIAYKNAAVPANSAVPAGQLAPAFEPLGLSEREIDALTAFVERALRDPRLERYVPEAVPSGSCIPVNDEAARSDLGC